MIAKNPFKIEAGTTKNLEYSDIRMEPKIKDILNTEIKGDSFPDRE
jgi:hypothetical protein